MSDVVLIDIFAGAGGLTEGFLRSGYTFVSHIEMDRNAIQTLETRGLYHHLQRNGDPEDYTEYVNGEIGREELFGRYPDFDSELYMNIELTEENRDMVIETIRSKMNDMGAVSVDGIIGGPPCQAYSYAGRSRKNMENDRRNYLYLLYIKFLKEFQPEFFVFENVPGMKSAKRGLILSDFQRKVTELGYKLDFGVHDAFDFGVPQRRRRIIVIGHRMGDEMIQFDKERYGGTVHDLLSDLPALEPGEGTDGPQEYRCKPSPILEEMGIRGDRDVLRHHRARRHNPRDREIYRRTIDAWNSERRRLKYTELPLELRTHRNTRSFLDRYKVVAGDLPFSHTVVAHISKDGHYYIHPDREQARSLTVREAARIQSFPDNYIFEGPMTSKYRQIGNAVPPLMSEKIALKLYEIYMGGF
ncbi:DNA cytosine methyltransferase [Methanothermobacter thermautotrophicus]|jgi:DNA (cytosine-5)-methyltransferase 1|uniref:DNA cytosine methyltransferase n=1 Tax=Methanothermobacter thermautotrophicus TaxID=145262 RepID=UPI0017FF0A18|nr:DNA cytosine methyltransferase [Methanothermobacter thermautotrophicus]WBF08559.1 DNA cytosine methyltransferase [Methanothermobacter thermautotrophicus]HIH70545.1 DNA cytosine methyltransferase [Methanothermobacter thermautotrophicus]